MQVSNYKVTRRQFLLRQMMMQRGGEWMTAKEIYRMMKPTLLPYEWDGRTEFVGTVGRAIQKDIHNLNFSPDFDKRFISSKSKGYKLADKDEFDAFYEERSKQLKTSLGELEELKHLVHRDGQGIIEDPSCPGQREFHDCYVRAKQ